MELYMEDEGTIPNVTAFFYGFISSTLTINFYIMKWLLKYLLIYICINISGGLPVVALLD